MLDHSFNRRPLFEFTGRRAVFDVNGRIVFFENSDGSVETFEAARGGLIEMNEKAKRDAIAQADAAGR